MVVRHCKPRKARETVICLSSVGEKARKEAGTKDTDAWGRARSLCHKVWESMQPIRQLGWGAGWGEPGVCCGEGSVQSEPGWQMADGTGIGDRLGDLDAGCWRGELARNAEAWGWIGVRGRTCIPLTCSPTLKPQG